MTAEKKLERKFVESVRMMGGLAIKQGAAPGSGIAGLPDRLALIPGGVSCFVEFKSTGQKPDPLQDLTIRKLRKMGFIVFVCDNVEALDGILSFLISRLPIMPKDEI